VVVKDFTLLISVFVENYLLFEIKDLSFFEMFECSIIAFIGSKEKKSLNISIKCSRWVWYITVMLPDSSFVKLEHHNYQ
jgi:hypothetical protein